MQIKIIKERNKMKNVIKSIWVKLGAIAIISSVLLFPIIGIEAKELFYQVTFSILFGVIIARVYSMAIKEKMITPKVNKVLWWIAGFMFVNELCYYILPDKLITLVVIEALIALIWWVIIPKIRNSEKKYPHHN